MADMFESDDENLTITINKRFADTYEKKKQNEELTKLKEKYGDIGDEKIKKAAERKKQYSKNIYDPTIFESDDDDESTSEEEDEFGELITPEVDAQIMKTILKVRTKDDDIYNSEKKFFSEQEMEEARKKWKEKQEKQKSEKPMHLKEYHRKVLLGEIKDDEEEKPKTFAEEQKELKRDLINEIGNIKDDDAEDFFEVKKKTKEEEEFEEDDYRTFLLENMADNKNPNALKEWKDYKENPNVDKDEAFLMDYILNRGWIEKGQSNPISLDVEKLSEDESEVERADEFESKYNFRFEEEGGTQLVTHSRNIEGSMRRKDNSRKLKRESVKSRKEEEKKRREEELKRLKNLKKQEIFNKLKQIQEITGNKNVGIDDIDLEGEFDPNDYDDKMQKMFNDEYYEAEDAGEKPVFADDINIDDIVTEEYNNVEKSLNEEEPVEDNTTTVNPNEDEDDFIMDADYLPGGQFYEPENSKKKKKLSKKQLKREKKLAKKRQKQLESQGIQLSDQDKNKTVNEYLDEYYQLDYEDMIGDLPTRFKYHKVKPENYGLSAVEILLADDKDLNEYISLKKLAPHRSEEKQMKDEIKFNRSKKKRLSAFKKSIEDKMKAYRKSLEENQQESQNKATTTNKSHKSESSEEKKNKKHKKSHTEKESKDNNHENDDKSKKKRKRKKAKTENDESNSAPEKKKSKKGKIELTESRLASYGA